MSQYILVTGAHGFIGRNIAKKFKNEGYKVYGIGHGKWLSDSFKDFGIDFWLEADISVKVISELNKRFSFIIHCAGSGSVEYVEQDPYRDFYRTIGTTNTVLEYIRKYNRKTKLIFISSAAVYGNKGKKRISENDSRDPISCYGYNKKNAEDLCISYSQQFNLDIAIIRFFSVYGVGLKRLLIWDALTKFNKTKGRAVFTGKGTEVRDWLYIDDAVNLIYTISKINNKEKIYNGGSGKKTTVKEFITLIAKEIGIETTQQFSGKNNPIHPRYYSSDISRASATGWCPTVSLRQGVRKYVQWYKEYEKRSHNTL